MFHTSIRRIFALPSGTGGSTSGSAAGTIVGAASTASTPANFTVTLGNGVTTGYAVLYTGSADEGSRVSTTGGTVSLTPQSAGSYKARLYSSASGGVCLWGDTGFCGGWVNTSSLPTLATATPVGWYDASDATNLTLASASVKTTTANISGTADRVSAVANKIVSGSPMPALAKISADQYQQNGARYHARARLSARAVAWAMQQAGQAPADAVYSPACGQYPAITGISAAVGQAYEDVTVSNPNAATTLVLGTDPLRGWEVYRGAQTKTMGGLGTYEATQYAGTGIAGAASLGVASVALHPTDPFKVRLTLNTAPTSGQKVTVYYGRNGSPNTDGSTTPKIPLLDMLTDNAATVYASTEPLLDSRFRLSMPVTIMPQGMSQTLS